MQLEWSLNELNLMVRRATRGAGFAWGIAEEAGKATRWLCSFGLDGVGLLIDELDEASKKKALVNVNHHTWVGKSALLIGIALIDRVGFSLPHRIEGLKNPLFLAPFMAQRAQEEQQSLTLECTQGSITVTPSGRLSMHSHLSVYHRLHLNVSNQDHLIIGEEHYYQYRAFLNLQAIECLTELAQRTYVPDSLSNSASDAGAGLLDKD